MDVKAKEALLLNRVKILKFCDYFVVTAPLIAKRILPMEKHKEFKNRVGLVGPTVDLKAANNARLDSLLEFMDECSTPGAFDAFIEGVKNCEGQKMLAKDLKRQAEGFVPRGPAKKAPVKRPAPAASSFSPAMSLGSLPGSGSGNSSFIKLESPNVGPVKGVFSPTLGPPLLGPVAPKKAKKSVGAKKSPLLLQNGPSAILTAASAVTSTTPTPVGTPTTAAAKRRASGKAPALNKPKEKKKPTAKIQLNGQGGTIKLEANPPNVTLPKKKAAPKKKANANNTKIVGIPAPIPATTPVKIEAESKPSTSGASSSKRPFVSKVPVGSPFRPRSSSGQSKLKKMTFLEVEEKQRTATRATTFNFVNPSAVVKTIHFNNKSDLFYEGCPTKTNNQLCAKKVQLKGKGKKYVCKEKHENESYELFPRLYVTFEDPTTHMQTTLYRENVEVLAGKPVSELHRMDDETLKGEFFKAHNKNIPIEVKCKKILKKEIKKAGGATWDNVATIITDNDGPSAKRSRKSTD